MKLLHEILGHQLMLDIKDDRDKYPDKFFHWLQFNEHVWKEFENKALTMAKYRKRFSARTIVEVMRWNNIIKQKGEPTFKLNDHYTPGMARLWMAKHGKDFPKFFELRN